MRGKPAIRGTRIPVELILRKLSEGATEADLLVGWKANSAINFLSDLKGYDSLAVEAIEPGDTRYARSSCRQV